ncbi:hypothetical protein SLS53_000648 [Cytospora paraplurivora]|uniref:Acid phosphatase-like protein n=1 Tax=Cytospora paraplurivora TaxID=2898453 RepID=A0AAN9UJ81_9PEZI
MVGTGGAIIIAVLVIAAVGALAWILYGRWRAQKLGLPAPSITSFIPFHRSNPNPYGPPSPAPGGVVGWFNDQVRKFKARNNRSAAGAYEGAPPGARGRRGFGPLDPDEAWDARVGNEADNYGPGGYYEEQELGLHDPPASSRGPYSADTAYGGGPAAATGGGVGPVGLSITPQQGGAARGFGGEERGRTLSRDGGRNPFDDEAADAASINLRGVSPRPMDGLDEHGQGHDSAAERKSIFRENV